MFSFFSSWLGTCLGSQDDNGSEDDSCLAAKFWLIRMASKATKLQRKNEEKNSENTRKMFNESSSLWQARFLEDFVKFSIHFKKYTRALMFAFD